MIAHPREFIALVLFLTHPFPPGILLNTAFLSGLCLSSSVAASFQSLNSPTRVANSILIGVPGKCRSGLAVIACPSCRVYVKTE